MWRHRGLIIVVATAAAVVAPMEPIATAGPGNTGSPGDVQYLYAALPGGFGPVECQPIPIEQGQLASLQCGGNADTDLLAPAAASFVLLRSQDVMDAYFAGAVEGDEVGDCPDYGPSPQHWQGQDGGARGAIACGLRDGMPELLWTNDSTLVLGSVQGLDLESLFDWWNRHG